MVKKLRFLTLFSFGGFILIQMVINSIGLPFNELRNAWLGLLFGQEYTFDLSLVRTSLVNTIFVIAIISFLVFSIKRFRDDRAKNSFLNTLLQVTIVVVLFFAIDMVLISILGYLVRIQLFTVYSYLTGIFYTATGILNFLSLATVVNKGKISWQDFKATITERKYSIAVATAIITYFILLTTPNIALHFFEKPMPQLWHSLVMPVLVSIAFTSIIRPVLTAHGRIS